MTDTASKPKWHPVQGKAGLYTRKVGEATAVVGAKASSEGQGQRQHRLQQALGEFSSNIGKMELKSHKVYRSK